MAELLGAIIGLFLVIGIGWIAFTVIAQLILSLSIVSFALLVIIPIAYYLHPAPFDRFFSKNKSRRESNGSHQHESKSRIKDERHYSSILGLTDIVSPESVKKAYRGLAKKYHPDMVHYLGSEFREVAEAKLKEINEAYGYFCQKYGF